MKFMVSWTIPSGNCKGALDRFLETGAPVPEGLTKLGRWHAPSSTRGWLLVESDDLTMLAQHLSEWADLLEFDVTPVTEDDQAAEAAKRTHRV